MTAPIHPHKQARSLLTRRAQFLMNRENMFPVGSRALLMVSGGRDSVALLHLLRMLNGRRPGPSEILALHINHHLRGAESDADEALVARTCGSLGVELVVAHCPIEKASGNVQESARSARREVALQMANDRECARIVLGHTVDDQVETMLYRLARYGGLAAFRGMTACEFPWARPLLECRRTETAAYCVAHGLEYCEDTGNAYPGYARTGLRERVLPVWEEVLSGAVEAAARAAEVASEIEGLLECILMEARNRVSTDSARAASLESARGFEAEELSASRLLQLNPAVRRLLLHQWLEEHARSAASRASVLAVEALLVVPGAATRAIGGGWCAVKDYDRLRLQRGALVKRPVSGPVALSLPGEVEWEGLFIQAEYVERFSIPDLSRESYVDVRALMGPLTVRGPQPGDRLWPLGAQGTRKLQDLFVDLKISARERVRLPVVMCGDRIIWVCGLAIAEEGRIRRDTTSIVRFSVSRRCEG